MSRDESLYERTRRIWIDSDAEARAGRWVDGLEEARAVVEAHRRTFRAWSPLRPYITLGDAKRPSPLFSWRFRGQEVAKMRVDLLAEADRSVHALAGHFAMSRPAVSQHLRVLLDAGLVTEQRHGRERRYRLVPEQLGPVRDWLARYERFWDDRLQRLQKLLAKRSQE